MLKKQKLNDQLRKAARRLQGRALRLFLSGFVLRGEGMRWGGAGLAGTRQTDSWSGIERTNADPKSKEVKNVSVNSR